MLGEEKQKVAIRAVYLEIPSFRSRIIFAYRTAGYMCWFSKGYKMRVMESVYRDVDDGK